MARKWLLALLIISTLYLIISLIYYTNETSVLEGYPVFAAIYLALVTIHGVIYGIGLLISWLGYYFHKSGVITLGSILEIIAGILFFPSLLVILPLWILILIFNKKDIKEAVKKLAQNKKKAPWKPERLFGIIFLWKNIDTERIIAQNK